jgi:hypothetical protein
MLIGGLETEKSEARGRKGEGFGRKNVEEVCSHTKGSDPEGKWYTRVEEWGANHIISGMNNAFGFANLSGSVGARHAKETAVGGKERTSMKVVKFTPIVALNSLNRNAKLSVNVSEKNRQGGEGVGLKA